jgi:hypothetical protein
VSGGSGVAARPGFGEEIGGLGQPRRRLELGLGVDHLGAAITLGFRLAGHRALHVLGDPHVLDLDGDDLDSPRFGLLVDDALQFLVEVLALGEQGVELGLAEHGPQRGLRDLGRRLQVVLDVDDRGVRVHDAEVRDGIHTGGHVVAGDDVLRGDRVRDRVEGHPHHAVGDRHE